MSLLLSCQAVTKAYGSAPLFTDLSFGLFEGGRVGLVGPNGSGKSTLLKILAGIEPPDRGTVSLRRQVKLGYVPQQVEFPEGRTIEDVMTEALAVESLDESEHHTRLQITLGKMGFEDPAAPASRLSGGWRKRLAIACALVRQPDLLLLDEPTNHLDLEGILWLERLLRAETFAWLTVSHDRAFLSSVANRVLELNRRHPDGLLDSEGSYSDFLVRKADLLEAFERREETLANRVRREIEWLRRGPKARTTKAKARIDEAERLQSELADVRGRSVERTARIDFSASNRRTRRLLVAEGIDKRFGERTILSSLDLTLAPGMRLGLLGPNGSGKSTLLRLLAGEIEPDAGWIERADDLRVVYFDQDREQLDGSVTLRRTFAPDGDQVVYRDRPIHVAGWAKRFLFESQQLEMPVGRMSGGERARVLIARLMLRPADLLILDEPTNDLDLDTLEALEESLLEFPGALVLVTHDRFLFDRVSTSVLALDGRGGAERFADYAQWDAECARRSSAEGSARDASRTASPSASTRASTRARPAEAGARRLSYMEQREWDQMEEKILTAEAELEACAASAADPDVASRADVVAERYRELEAAQQRVEALYARWAELEEKGGASRR
ncbi:MAG: ABC-F family ATP-binding cassette domain-containing protein [Deltaproteobacteria bacterium]|nr:ABC-F family ATP-binding cassette domain-containing protein [Deltaproteobacteria bacterium]